MIKRNILLLGAEGQLGKSIRAKLDSKRFNQLIYSDIRDIDISNAPQVISYIDDLAPDIVINTAAYTAVDRAEEEIQMAYAVNSKGAENLALACLRTGSKLIHISTDYVYNNEGDAFQKEDASLNPTGVYACSKLDGEQRIQSKLKEHLIIRTSWLYSEFGHNFVKTILRLTGERDEISVVKDQFGAPTYAGDLANAIVQIIEYLLIPSNKHKDVFGVYNYSNIGEISWYEFAKAIVELSERKTKVSAISSSEYPTAAPRPLNSRMDTGKIKEVFDMDIPFWKDSLAKCLRNLSKVE